MREGLKDVMRNSCADVKSLSTFKPKVVYVLVKYHSATVVAPEIGTQPFADPPE